MLPLAPIKRIIEKAGATRVSKKSLMSFAEVLEDLAIDLSAEALLLAKHAGRKTITKSDVKLAKKKM